MMIGDARPIPLRARASMFVRLLAVQSSWNYETLIGNGVGFCLEPALRGLPGGPDGPAYRAALARQSQYFNAHPYLTALAVGALARAELDGEQPERIDRFRAALCGPLGALGDRLVWASFLPLCSFAALAIYGLGASGIAAALAFALLYNAGHLTLRAWALHTGLRDGLRVGNALGNPVLQRAPQRLGAAATVLSGFALPVALERVIGPGEVLLGGVLVSAILGAALLVRLHGRTDGWKVAILVLAAFILYSELR